jgi:hypothetical protein
MIFYYKNNVILATEKTEHRCVSPSKGGDGLKGTVRDA